MSPSPGPSSAQQEVVTLPLVAIKKIEAELPCRASRRPHTSTREVEAAGAGAPWVGGAVAKARVLVVICSQNGSGKQSQDVGFCPASLIGCWVYASPMFRVGVGATG